MPRQCSLNLPSHIKTLTKIAIKGVLVGAYNQPTHALLRISLFKEPYVFFNTCEGEATRLAELALIFIPIYNVALSAKYRSKLHYK